MKHSVLIRDSVSFLHEIGMMGTKLLGSIKYKWSLVRLIQSRPCFNQAQIFTEVVSTYQDSFSCDVFILILQKSSSTCNNH